MSAEQDALETVQRWLEHGVMDDPPQPAIHRVADQCAALRSENGRLRRALEKIEAKLDATLDGISAVEPEVGIPPHYETLTECYKIARRAREASHD